jgi:hypothetical protein
MYIPHRISLEQTKSVAANGLVAQLEAQAKGPDSERGQTGTPDGGDVKSEMEDEGGENEDGEGQEEDEGEESDDVRRAQLLSLPTANANDYTLRTLRSY